jgi:flagellar motor switch protein FliG
MALPAKKKDGLPERTELTGPEKAAVILLSLGEEAQKIWRLLDDEEIKEVSQAMSMLGVVSAPMVEGLILEFVQ